MSYQIHFTYDEIIMCYGGALDMVFHLPPEFTLNIQNIENKISTNLITPKPV